jgi:two-component system chemotaxis response regulator CheY
MGSLSALKVLIVDPAKSLRDVLPTALNGAGIFDIHRLTDWTAATPASAAGRHLMFVDWDAGPRQAFGLARSIRVRGASGWNPQIPVIMVMAQASAPAIQQMRNGGVNEILLKPLTTAAVVDRLSRVILKPRPFVDCDAYFGPERRRSGNRPFGGPFRRSADGLARAWA